MFLIRFAVSLHDDDHCVRKYDRSLHYRCGEPCTNNSVLMTNTSHTPLALVAASDDDGIEFFSLNYITDPHF